jgi:MFS family permease
MTKAPISPLTASERRRGIISAIACLTTVAISIGATLPLLALALQRQGVSAVLIGVSSATPAVGGLLITPLFRWLLKRFDTKWLLLVSVWISVACCIAYYALPDVWIWFPIRLVHGAALVILFAVSETSINQLADDRTRGRLMGIYSTVLAFGFTVGPFILITFGSEGLAPYAIVACLLLFASLPIALAGPAAQEIAHGPGRGVLAFFRIAPTTIFAAFTFGALEQGTMTLMPVYGVRAGLTEGAAALILSAFAAGNILSQIPLGVLADGVDRRVLLVMCALIGALSVAALPLVQGSMLVMPIIFVFGGVVTGLYTVGLILLGQRFRGADLAASNAAFIMMYNFGGLAGPAVGGSAMELAPGYGLPLSFAAIALLYAGIAGRRFAREARREDDQDA